MIVAACPVIVGCDALRRRRVVKTEDPDAEAAAGKVDALIANGVPRGQLREPSVTTHLLAFGIDVQRTRHCRYHMYKMWHFLWERWHLITVATLTAATILIWNNVLNSDA